MNRAVDANGTSLDNDRGDHPVEDQLVPRWITWSRPERAGRQVDSSAVFA